MPNPMDPQIDEWLARIQEEFDTIGEDWDDEPQINVLAHSLGSIAWMHFAAANSQVPLPIADRVLLVAPPYHSKETSPPDLPAGMHGFFPPPLDPAAIRTVASETALIAGENDEFATADRSREYAEKLEIPFYELAGAGHISPFYGYGGWPWVMDWCLRLAELPPRPR